MKTTLIILTVLLFGAGGCVNLKAQPGSNGEIKMKRAVGCNRVSPGKTTIPMAASQPGTGIGEATTLINQ